MKRRITPLAVRRLGENQLAFREGKGTRDGICQLRILSKRMIEKKKKMFICFIDHTKAFDRVKHNKLLEVLEKYDIPQEEIRLISNLYWNQTAVVRTINGESRSFKIKKGVRQGCILSSILFNM